MRQALYILGQLSDDDVEWLISSGRRRAAASGEALIREGQPVPSLFILLDGGVVVERGGKRLAEAGAGEFLGELSFVDSRPPAATVRVLRDAKLLEVSRTVLAEQLRRDLGFASRFYRAVAVFLADRLRTNLGAGGPEGDDELDPDVLDEVSAAGARFERILHRLLQA